MSSFLSLREHRVHLPWPGHVPRPSPARELVHRPSRRPLHACVGEPRAVRVALAYRRVLRPLVLLECRVARQHGPEELPVVLGALVGVVVLDGLDVGPFRQRRHDLERVPLVDEVLLPLRGVVHLLRVGADEGVEEGVEGGAVRAVRLGVRLGAEDATEALRLLPTGAEVGRDLDDNVGLGEVDRRVPDLADADRPQGTVRTKFV